MPKMESLLRREASDLEKSFCIPVKPSAPIAIPVQRRTPARVSYSPYPRPIGTPELLFEMDPLSYGCDELSLDSPFHDERNVEPYLYSFPLAPTPPLSTLNNGQSKAGTPCLSPSSSCSSASDIYEGGCRIDPWPKVQSQSETRQPLLPNNTTATVVVRPTPANKITGFAPCGSASTPHLLRGGDKPSTIPEAAPRRRHTTIVACPTWYRSTAYTLDAENFIDEKPELPAQPEVERVSRFHRKRNFSSDSRL